MFETYEDRFPFESDFLDGDEPKAQVERLQRGADAPCRFHTTPEGLKRFAQSAEAFSLEALFLNVTGHTGSLGLEALSRPEDIKSLTILQSVQLGEPFGRADVEGLARYGNITKLHLGLVHAQPDWFAPDLTLQEISGDHESISDHLQDRSCHEIEKLDITHLKGDFDDMPRLNRLSWLRIRGAKLSSLSAIADRCPILETLIVESGRTPMDVRSLQHLNNLRGLKLLGPGELVGLDELHLAALQECYLSCAKTSRFFDQNPGLNWFRVKKFEGEPSPGMLERGWQRLGKEAGTGDGFIPETLRN